MYTILKFVNIELKMNLNYTIFYVLHWNGVYDIKGGGSTRYCTCFSYDTIIVIIVNSRNALYYIIHTTVNYSCFMNRWVKHKINRMIRQTIFFFYMRTVVVVSPCFKRVLLFYFLFMFYLLLAHVTVERIEKTNIFNNHDFRARFKNTPKVLNNSSFTLSDCYIVVCIYSSYYYHWLINATTNLIL